MKHLKSTYLSAAMILSAALSGCQADMDAPEMEIPVASMTPNITIADFKTEFATTDAQLVGNQADGQPYIIHGRVVSSDASGNIYKSLVIQDETAAMAISLNQSSTYVEYRIGQEVVLNVTGLYMGKYRGLQQLGWLGTPYDGTPQLNFMAYDLFLGHSEKNGVPNQNVQYVNTDDTWPSDNPYCVVTEIASLPSSGEKFRNITSQLVEFRNVSFVDGGKEIFAPYQESVSRYIQDAAGNQIIVRNSGYSTFYNDTLPAGTGTVRGILSYYGSEWQLLLRTREDVIFKSKGQKSDPYTVEEAIAEQNTGEYGWVKGYIVGSVKGGVQNVSSNSDIIFGADAEMDNNLVIGPNASVKDYSQCVVVNLPQGSDFRKYGNLVDNPGVLGKEILLSGNLATYLGMAGVTGNTGKASEFEIEGVNIGGGGTPAPTGDGSKDSPFSVAQVLSSTADQTGVWIEGYLVGYVSGMTWSDTAVFGNTPDTGSTNYNNATNCILSDQAVGNANLNNSIPTGLGTGGDVRANLGISKNPSVFGKKVKVKGDITKYFGMRGVKNVSEYEIIDGQGGGTVTPTPTPAGGDGSIENPFSVAQVQASTEDVTGAYITGYVVGYVSGMTWSDTAVFGNTPDTGSNYTNATNCILSDKPVGSAVLDNSIPAGIKAGETRDVLGISKNPSIYGKKVRVKGDITKYFGLRAVKNISEATLLD